jgi:acyl carrier protein
VDDSLGSLHTILHCGVATVSSYRVPEAKGPDGAGGEGGGQGSVDLAGLCTETVQAKIAEILGGAATDYDPAFPLQEYGLDSLSIVEVVNWINRYVRVKVTPSFINAQTTIDGIHKYMQDNLLSSV